MPPAPFPWSFHDRWLKPTSRWLENTTWMSVTAVARSSSVLRAVVRQLRAKRRSMLSHEERLLARFWPLLLQQRLRQRAR